MERVPASGMSAVVLNHRELAIEENGAFKQPLPSFPPSFLPSSLPRPPFPVYLTALFLEHPMSHLRWIFAIK